METILNIVTWIVASCISAELLGYGLHRLLPSGAIGFLSRSHMNHHLVLYGPLQDQRSIEYHDATEDSVSLGNIGLEWLLPAGLLIACALAVFQLFHVQLLFRVIYFATTLAWSFLMFSYLHDIMHVEGFWLEKNRWLKRWFTSARRLHDIHHEVINDQGLMDKNFGIGFFICDRLFGTLCSVEPAFNYVGYKVARERFRSIVR